MPPAAPPPDASPAAARPLPQDPPHAIDAERAVLGALLMNNELFKDIEFSLKEDFFYNKRHQLIWRYGTELHEKGHADPFLLTQRLREHGKLADAGGEEYIAEIADVGAAPINLRAYAELIAGKAMQRELIGAHVDGVNESYRPEDKTPHELLDKAEARLSEISEKYRQNESRFSAANEVAQKYMEKVLEHKDDMSKMRGTHPGFPTLYEKTLGLQGGDLIILAGRPGAGKTAFGLNLLRNVAAQKGLGALCFSLEMSAEQLVMRLLGHHGLNTHKMRRADKISPRTLRQLAEATSSLEELPIFIDDNSTLNILEARTRARRVKRDMAGSGIKLGLVMVDYLQLMQGSGTNTTENRALEVSAISRGLKALAKELNVPVLALSQLNRSVERRGDGRPMLSDLRDSGSIEQDADTILFLRHKNEGDQDAGDHVDIHLVIGKQRNGPIGKINMEFNKPFSKFTEAANADDDTD